MEQLKYFMSIVLIINIVMLVSCNPEGFKPTPTNYIINGPQDLNPAFSHDGNYIAYVHLQDTAKSYPTGLYIIDKNGSNRRRVIKGSYYQSPSWSPNGRWLVFSNGHILKCKINGDSLTYFTGLDQLTYPEFYNPKWSSNSKFIMFNKPLGVGETSLYSTTSDFKHSGKLFGLSISTGNYPTLSPNLEKLVYSKGSQSFTAGVELFIADTLGIKDIRLTNNDRDDREPTWSPDSKRIAWSSDLRLSVMNFDGSDQREIGYGNSPSWSINNEIVFSHANSDYTKEVLYIISPDGQNQRQITF